MAFQEGQFVSWKTSQGRTHGKVVSNHAADLSFKGQTFRASDKDPVYVVESEETGARAAHHEGSLENSSRYGPITARP
ncbi:hypervirulence associated TUDOR domain-containing protein [Nesterenkonia haasae]|uniref:DUF2945 domain-containing protein n=1 Tax=Nesterenkonia haasae TaxID=2587813 RepID=UPI001390BB8C|nr:DUF2945 domain-containing protein [Nesterenkonia haasae]NDK31137.1 DUF2945 domain-containing protein [Nesterenkonia haasae]